jgi:large subunit ribosomal protein L24
MLARIKKGDLVKVIVGHKKVEVDGKIVKKKQYGIVLKVLPKKQQVIVEQVNMKHTRQKVKDQEAMKYELKEYPIHISNVVLVDPTTVSFIGSDDESKKVKSTRVGTKILTDKTKVRVAVKSGEIIKDKS